jgi:glycosyltransferase involved in cell wall biosynthesis
MGKEPEKRILVFTYWAFQDALIQTYTLPYLKIMAENQSLKIWLVCLQPNSREISNAEFSSIQEALSLHRIQLILLKYKPLGVMGYINTGFILLQLFYLALTLRISIIHAWGTPAGALGYLIAKVLNRKLVLDSYEPHAEATVENGDWKRNGLPFRFLFKMEKLQTHYAATVIAVTEVKYNKRFESNFFVKPACVDFKLFDYRKRNLELKASLGLKDKIVGLYAGKFGGIYLDTEFFQWVKVAEQYWGDKFRLLLLTNHSEKEILKFCSEAGVNARTIYQKFVPHHEVPMYMGLADFALSIVKPVPSKRYCSPIKEGEYWAMGLPVIITKGISDDSEIIQNESIGYVLESLNEKEYLNSVCAIEKCFSEPGIRDRIVRVAEKFRSFEIARDVYSHVYPE